MDILMIYWNSVWTDSRRDTASLLGSHSGAELAAYERALGVAARPAAAGSGPGLGGRTRTREPSGTPPMSN